MPWKAIARILPIALLCACVCTAQEKRRFEKKWLISAAALVAANFFDVYTSRNMMESNPLLRGNGGAFSSSKGVSIKFAASGALLATQWFFLSRKPDHRLNRSFAITNGVLTGVVSAVAIHNYSLRSSSATSAPSLTPAIAALPAQQ